MDHSSDDTPQTPAVPFAELSAVLLGQLQHEVACGRLRDRTQGEPVPPLLMLDIFAD